VGGPKRVIAHDYKSHGGLWPGFAFIYLPFPSFSSILTGQVSLANVPYLFLLELGRWTLCMHEYIFGLWKGTC
jgi:hypothetical protein